MIEYQTILADPPWQEPGGGKIKRGADKHYETMDVANIMHAIIRDPQWRPAKNCHLYMCSTTTSLLDSLWLMKALGFDYKTHIPWIKSDGKINEETGELNLTIGLGQYFRICSELVLFGVRGKGMDVRTESLSLRNVIVAPVPRGDDGKRIHSRKPPKLYELIEARSKGPRLEMFSRVRREGWDHHGDEVPAPADPNGNWQAAGGSWP